MKVQKILDRDGMNTQVPKEWLDKVPKSFILLWEKWQDRQSGNSYWENPLHC